MPHPCEKCTAAKVLMVRPCCFAFNEDTAATNSFQVRVGGGEKSGDVNALAAAEFDGMVEKMRREFGLEVEVVQDVSGGPYKEARQRTPDSVFPNNWFSTHENSLAILYPMNGENRRLERRGGAHEYLTDKYKVIEDLTSYESEGRFLEGTGAIVLDRCAKMCFASVSPRCDGPLVRTWCAMLHYEPSFCGARRSKNGEPVYHTNVMLSIAPHFVVCCLAVIKDEAERKTWESQLRGGQAPHHPGRHFIEITEDQCDNFCGNVLCLRNKHDEYVTVMSTTAYRAFTQDQLALMGTICAVDIPTIEAHGGGSARCMLAELFT